MPYFLKEICIWSGFGRSKVDLLVEGLSILCVNFCILCASAVEFVVE